MGVDSQFCKHDRGGRLVAGDFIFPPPFSWQSPEGHGQPFSRFRTASIQEVISDLTGIDIAPDEPGKDSEHGWHIDTPLVLEIARRLEAHLCQPSGLLEWDEDRATRTELADLARVFRRYGEAGFLLCTG